PRGREERRQWPRRAVHRRPMPQRRRLRLGLLRSAVRHLLGSGRSVPGWKVGLRFRGALTRVMAPPTAMTPAAPPSLGHRTQLRFLTCQLPNSAFAGSKKPDADVGAAGPVLVARRVPVKRTSPVSA